MAFNWLFGSSKGNDTAKKVEEAVKDSEKIKAEIDNVQGSLLKNSKYYQDNIKKYKDIAKFNQQLTRSYISNMKVMVDVSDLLNNYANVFSSLREEFAKMESALGKPLELADFEYLENLTKTKIDVLNSEFQKQSNGIKKLYAEYGQPNELNRIILAQGDVQKVIDNANSTFSSLKKSTNTGMPNVETVLQPSLTGGKKGKGTAKKSSKTIKTTNGSKTRAQK